MANSNFTSIPELQARMIKHVKKLKIVMQPFNLTRLNMYSPYPVWQNNESSYSFRT